MSKNRENADKLKVAPLGVVTDGNSSPITSDAVYDALALKVDSSAMTTALNLKAPLASPTFTGTVVLPSTTSIGTITNTELSYIDGVTSAIQTQLNGKAQTNATDTIAGGAVLYVY